MKDLNELKSLQNVIRQTDQWIGVSECLNSRGIDSSKIIIAEVFPEDGKQEYWLIITPQKNIYEFYYDWLHKLPDKGEIIEWHDFTNNLDEVYMNESAESVLNHFNELI